jgi:hypothetical protein
MSTQLQSLPRTAKNVLLRLRWWPRCWPAARCACCRRGHVGHLTTHPPYECCCCPCSTLIATLRRWAVAAVYLKAALPVLQEDLPAGTLEMNAAALLAPPYLSEEALRSWLDSLRLQTYA